MAENRRNPGAETIRNHGVAGPVGVHAEIDAAYAEAALLRTQHAEPLRLIAAMLLRRSEEIGYRRGSARASLLAAWAEWADRRLIEAAHAAESALQELRALGDDEGAAGALNLLGSLARRTGDIARAARCHNDAIEHARRAKSARETSIALRGIGTCEMMTGNVAAARRSADDAWSIAQAAGCVEEQIDVLQLVGTLEAQSGRYAEALATFTRALEMTRAIGHRRLEAQTIGNLAPVHAHLGNRSRARRYDLEALAIHREMNDALGTAERLGNIGTRYQEIGDYTRAFASFSQALEIFERLGEKTAQSVVLGNLGVLYLVIGDYVHAGEALHRSLAMARISGNRPCEAYALMVLGKVSERLGQPRQGLLYYLQSLRLCQESGDLRAESEDCLGIGQLYTMLDEYEEAESFLERGLSLVRSLGLRSEEATLLTSRGRLEARRGNAPRALELLEQGLAIARTNDNPVLVHAALEALVETSRNSGQAGRANQYLHAADEALRRAFDDDSRDRVRTIIAQYRDAAIEREARRAGLRQEDLARLAALPQNEPAGRPEAAVAAAPEHAPLRRIQVRMLGAFTVTIDGRDLEDSAWGRKRARELLKLLAARHRQWLTIDEIFEQLWGDHAGQQIEMVVMKTVSNLRKALGGIGNDLGVSIRHDNGSYMLDLGEHAWIDFLAFKEEVVKARRSASAWEREQHYGMAVSMYRGEFLPQERFAGWSGHEREILRDGLLESLEFLARESLRSGATTDAVERARRIVAEDPLNETGYDVLVQALEELGRTSEAQRFAEEYARAYRAEFGEDPPAPVAHAAAEPSED
ncbi:MAG TPA: tetratricopeptide repeat protein [Candidatus Kapabacteria bacterium]|nr:tetratricopeptide repeat protein [Candidatus Kapabacteria bacterium]